jgi:ferredoxin
MAIVLSRNDRCQGHGRCYSLCPAVFEPDDEGFSVVAVPRPSVELEPAARLAAEACPERAIVVTELAE